MNPTHENHANAFWYDQRDGLVDILTGLVALGFGIGLFADLAWLGAILAAVVLPIWSWAKQAISAPRMKLTSGTTDPPRSAIVWAVLLLGLVILALVVVLSGVLTGEGNASTLREWMQTNLPLAFGFLWAILLSALGALLHSGRFVLYALAALSIFIFSQLAGVSIPVTMIVLGALLFLSGLLVLLNFIRSHPAQND